MSSSSSSSRQYCREVTPQCPVELSTYGYYPSLAASYAFIIIFGLCFLGQLGLGFRYKTYPYMIVALIGMGGEAVGYGGRMMMHANPWSPTGFKMQICCLVLAPSFLAACIYLSLKHIVRYCGSHYSRLKPRMYTWYFIGGDFTSIVMQAIGGGIAAAGEHNRKIADVGDKIIIVGIAAQLVVMTIAAVFIGEFWWRLKKQNPIAREEAQPTGTPSSQSDHSDQEKAVRRGPETQQAMAQASGGPGVEKKFKLFCIGMAVAFLAIYIRCVYRIPEMSGGWGGPLMRKETEFYVLDGMMCAIASICFTVFHPAFFFPVMKKGFEW